MNHRNFRIITVLLTVFFLLLLAGTAVASEINEAEGAHDAAALGKHLPIWAGLPFVSFFHLPAHSCIICLASTA